MQKKLAPGPFSISKLHKHRQRITANFAEHSFLYDHALDELRARLNGVTVPFQDVLNLACRSKNNLQFEFIVDMELSNNFLNHPNSVQGFDDLLPFKPNCFDLIISNFNFHWINDLPGTLFQLSHILKPNGLLLAAFLGGETLAELRHCLLEAEAQLWGGASSRIAPMVDIRQIGDLLKRAGFALPVADTELITVEYDNLLALLKDLRGMGETAALHNNNRPVTQELLNKTEELYKKYYSEKGKLIASFEIYYLSAWSPHASQQQPLHPGTGKTHLRDALK
jgi:NADH dehydrogenase [ubiquinone] 1 alpha subcomplex assembly factor 5